MAKETTPSRVKNLFSSFLTNVEVVSSGKDTPINETPGVMKAQHKQGLNESRNRKLFYDRVESYSALTWFAKPLDMCPLVCARYGWMNVDTDMLQCVNCHVFLCATLPKDVDSPSYQESCTKLKSCLQESHVKVCNWSSNPSPAVLCTSESYFCVHFHNKEELTNDFLYRVISLSCVESLALSFSTFNDQGMTEASMACMVDNIKTACGEQPLSYQCAVLALAGWIHCESQLNILQCTYCRRKIGLWNYTHTSNIETIANTDCANNLEDSSTNIHKNSDSKENQSEVNDSAENGHINGDLLKNGVNGGNISVTNETDTGNEPQRKKQKIFEKQSLDPLSEHRYWCPWIQAMPPVVSPMSTNSTDDTPTQHSCPAWLTVARILSHTTDPQGDFCSHMKKSPQVDSLRHLRRVLLDCTSPERPKFPTLKLDSSVTHS